MTIARSIARPIASPIASRTPIIGGGGGGYRPETLAYQTRVSDAGGSMTTSGLEMVDAIFANAASQGISLVRGYVFGTAVNLNAAARTVLELTGNGQSFVADSASNDSTVHVGLGSLCHDGTTPQQGFFATASDQLFTNTDWTIFAYVQKPLTNNNNAAHTSTILSQYDTIIGSGRMSITAGQNGQYTVIPWNGTSVTMASRNANYGGGSLIEPCPMFVRYTASTRQIQFYDPLTPQLNTGGLATGDFASGVPSRLGAAQRPNNDASTPPRGQAYFGIVKYDGVLTTSQMDSIWSTFRTQHLKLCNYVLIYGNSVTSGSDAHEGTSLSISNWPQAFSRVAARNNCITIRPFSMGGKTLYAMRDVDFVKPVGSGFSGNYNAIVTSPLFAQDSVNYWGPRWAPNVLVIDENQNTAASQSTVVTYAIDWAGTPSNPGIARHVIEKLRGFNPDLKVAAGTMLAVGADGKSYATIISEETSVPTVWRRNLRDWSLAIRADTEGLYDAVYDLYADFNLGWDVADDGDALDPINDYPNGNPALYFDDPQHPNAAGHAIMATGYWNAVNAIKPY
jgi:hypothetical protein